MRLISTLLLLATLANAADRQVAITIDDLPRGGDGGASTLPELQKMTAKLLAPFAAQKIPLIGFVNQGRYPTLGDDALRQILTQWLDAGADLGNHTYSHPNINNVPLAEYEADVLNGEPVLRSVLAAWGKQLLYFRHPFLFTGKTQEDKAGLADFLKLHHYIEAPVTFDDDDYLFAAAYSKPEFHDRAATEYVPYMESIVAFFEQRSVEIFGREIPQILLIHASQLNADKMPELLGMFRKRGYSFVSLETALKDPAYSIPETYVGTNGFSWIHRWSRTKGMPNKGEPNSPAWLPKQ